jgi:hypothetical protein
MAEFTRDDLGDIFRGIALSAYEVMTPDALERFDANVPSIYEFVAGAIKAERASRDRYWRGAIKRYTAFSEN